MKHPYHDPITGDELTRLEYLTRQVQVLVRTPWFIVIFNVVTLAALRFGRMEAWNDFASWLAIIIEWLVGTFMWGQTGRDARVIREVRASSLRDEQTLARLMALEEQTEQQTEMLVRIVQEQAEIKQQTGHRSMTQAAQTACARCGKRGVPGEPGWYQHRVSDGLYWQEYAFCCEAHLKQWLAQGSKPC